MLKVFGIGAAQNPDKVGETILIDGIDSSRLNMVKDEHDKDDFFHIIGGVTYSKKIYSDKDCENDKQIRCWNHAKVPFLYVEGELADDTEHPNAKAAAEMIKWSQRSDVPLDIGFSIDGGIIERRDQSGQTTEDKETGKVLARTVATAVSLTAKRCNPKCKLFLENDLMKSIETMPAPKNYKDYLKKSQAKHSFNDLIKKDKEVAELVIFHKLSDLKKSLGNYFGAFTDLKCHNCSKGIRFFKSGDVPNACHHCQSSFSMSDLWKALNR